MRTCVHACMRTCMHIYIYIHIHIHIHVFATPPPSYLPFLCPETHFDSSSSKIVIPSPRFRRFSKEFEEASNPIKIRGLIDF